MKCEILAKSASTITRKITPASQKSARQAGRGISRFLTGCFASRASRASRRRRKHADFTDQEEMV